MTNDRSNGSRYSADKDFRLTGNYYLESGRSGGSFVPFFSFHFPFMKTSIIVTALLALLVINASAQTASQSATKLRAPTSIRVVDRGPHHKVWQWETYEQSPEGQIVPHIHQYTELATGLHYRSNGQWLDSKEVISILPDGTAAATNGQHQVYFPSDIYSGAIDLVTPDGRQIKSRPVGLSYDDGTNTVMIAELTNSIGYLVGTHQVIYPNAFTGFKADLRYTYTKSGFEQDVILRQQPPTPESLGLNADTARIQVLTEFFSPPPTTTRPMAMPVQAGLALTDQSINFGAMEMVQGRAFLVGTNASWVRVSKQWVLLDGRRFLVEEVPVDSIANELATLPLTAMNTGSAKTSHLASRHLALPPQRLAQKSTKSVLLAKADPSEPGFVLDYQTVNSTITTNFTFQSDTTYYISGSVNLYGTNTFEGGTVIKYAPYASISLYANTNIFLGSSYRPIVFTAVDDNTVGETISGSTGTPSGYYAYPALFFQNSAPFTLTDFRISYALYSILWGAGGGTSALTDGQFNNCLYGMILLAGGVNVENVLFNNDSYDFFGFYGTFNAQNCTFAYNGYVMSTIVSGVPSTYAFTNSVFAVIVGITPPSGSTAVGDHNAFFYADGFSTLGSNPISLSSYPYQTVGAGSYYLTSGSGCQSNGTANIDPILSANLASKTTQPPLVYSNVTLTANLTFSPQAVRDVNVKPDLGYHYDPLDYVFGGCSASSNLTFTVGTAVGWFGPSGSAYGFSLPSLAKGMFNGTATQPCIFTRYDTVQEGGNGIWTNNVSSVAGIIERDTTEYYNAAVINADFTHCYALSSDPNYFRDNGGYLTVYANNCEFYSGNLLGRQMALNMTNCLFDRITVGDNSETFGSSPNVALRNCSLHGGVLVAEHGYAPGWPFWIENCALDGTDLSSINDVSGGNTNFTYCNFNAFLTNSIRFPMLGTHDVTNIISFNWQSSWFGNYYLPTSSPLINAGSTTADQVGLYHFTTQTNQVPETNSIVDIGYHYVATDQYGNPLDTNGDGIPDYLEDANGNGLWDSGEINWNAYDTSLKVLISRPRNGTSLP